jgi:hypothetical protein
MLRRKTVTGEGAGHDDDGLDVEGGDARGACIGLSVASG